MDGAVLCVLRARFFRLEVRLFGTAMGLSRALRFWLEHYLWNYEYDVSVLPATALKIASATARAS
jgi:hypothetical protein